MKLHNRFTLEMYMFAAKRVDYDPESGIMTWKKRDLSESSAKRFNTQFAGKRCGRIGEQGYRLITFHLEDKKSYILSEHRLAWVISHGKLPLGDIDHINQDKADNRICNLRDVSKSVNSRNASLNIKNKSGVTGVYWDKKANKWRAQVRANGRKNYLGVFTDISEAEKAVKDFHKKHGFDEQHGKKKTCAISQ